MSVESSAVESGSSPGASDGAEPVTGCAPPFVAAPADLAAVHGRAAGFHTGCDARHVTIITRAGTKTPAPTAQACLGRAAPAVEGATPDDTGRRVRRQNSQPATP